MMAFGETPHPDPQIHQLLLELNEAQVAVTKQRMRALA
jgi:hypothetical protein